MANALSRLLFGFKINSEEKEDPNKLVRSFAPPENDEGAVDLSYLSTFGGISAYQFDIDGSTKTENELINRYREISNLADLDAAIEDIVSESIVFDEDEHAVSVSFVQSQSEDQKSAIPEKLQKKITDEFNAILSVMSFKDRGHDIFKRWYVDGRIYYHILIDEKKPGEGIQELRFVDPRKLKKVREHKNKDKKIDGFSLPQVGDMLEYYLYSDQFYTGSTTDKNAAMGGQRPQANSVQALKISADSIASSTSGLIDSRSNIILSHLHKAIRPANHLKMMEDALVIYRLTRAPEKRIFNVDIQDLPRGKSEQYMNEFMNRYRNKITYDAETGEIRDQKRIMSMIEDFFIPRRNGTQGTSIDILPGGQNLSQIEDVEYFMKKLYKSLNVPQSRLNPEEQFSLGRTNEVSREEVKYSQFINKLRVRFSMLFDDLLKKQLILKGIITPDEWDEIKANIKYDFIRNNYFTELKEAEILTNRLQLLAAIDPYKDIYFDSDYIMKKILKFDEDQINKMKKLAKKKANDEKAQMALDAENIDPDNINNSEMVSRMQGDDQQEQQNPSTTNESEMDGVLKTLIEELTVETKRRNSDDLL